jgi:hypothetical protein
VKEGTRKMKANNEKKNISKKFLGLQIGIVLEGGKINYFRKVVGGGGTMVSGQNIGLCKYLLQRFTQVSAKTLQA